MPMQYKPLAILSISIYAFLTSQSIGSTYHVSPSGSGHTCTDGVGGICDIYCDGTANGEIFDCANAGECNFYCDAFRCANAATINATLSNHLNIMAGDNGDECMRSSTVYAPNTGNATLRGGNSNKAFARMKVYAGSSTQNIIIDINSTQLGSNAQLMEVHAYSAQNVHISIANGNEWSSGILECPLLSSFGPVATAPCIIDARDGTLRNTEIYAPDGVPYNFWILDGLYGGTNTLFCANVDSYNGANEGGSSVAPFTVNSDCWWTANPTPSPTFEPTLSPTNPTIIPTPSPTDATSDPTSSPTKSTMTPSKSPTYNPTESPTIPTINPSVTPTVSPTIPTIRPTASPSDTTLNPTFTPSNHPTLPPTSAPSQTPSHAPTQSPSFSPTHAPSYSPTQYPSDIPTQPPSNHPTQRPSNSPTDRPSNSPSQDPSRSPSVNTNAPTSISTTSAPTVAPITSTPTDTPTRHPTVTPPTNSPTTSDPTVSPSAFPSKVPTLAPTTAIPTTANPSAVPSVFPSRTPTQSPITAMPSVSPRYWICENDCLHHESSETDKLRITVTYSFPQDIVYDLDNMECFMYQTFVPLFERYQFVDTFTICDLEIVDVDGGMERDPNERCEFPPCLRSKSDANPVNSGLLQNGDPIVSTIAIIAYDTTTYSLLNSLSRNLMEMQFADAFMDAFRLSMDADITVTNASALQVSETKLITNPLWYIIGGLVALLLLILCLLCWYMARSRRLRRKLSRKQSTDTDVIMDEGDMLKTNEFSGNTDDKLERVLSNSEMQPSAQPLRSVFRFGDKPIGPRDGPNGTGDSIDFGVYTQEAVRERDSAHAASLGASGEWYAINAKTLSPMEMVRANPLFDPNAPPKDLEPTQGSSSALKCEESHSTESTNPTVAVSTMKSVSRNTVSDMNANNVNPFAFQKRMTQTQPQTSGGSSAQSSSDSLDKTPQPPPVHVPFIVAGYSNPVMPAPPNAAGGSPVWNRNYNQYPHGMSVYNPPPPMPPAPPPPKHQSAPALPIPNAQHLRPVIVGQERSGSIGSTLKGMARSLSIGSTLKSGSLGSTLLHSDSEGSDDYDAETQHSRDTEQEEENEERKANLKTAIMDPEHAGSVSKGMLRNIDNLLEFQEFSRASEDTSRHTQDSEQTCVTMIINDPNFESENHLQPQETYAKFSDILPNRGKLGILISVDEDTMIGDDENDSNPLKPREDNVTLDMETRDSKALMDDVIDDAVKDAASQD